MDELLQGLGWFVIYIIVFVSALFVLRVTVKINDEVFRKMLHCVALGFVLVWVNVFDHWWWALAACLILMVPIGPALKLAQRSPKFSAFFSERKKGEIISSFYLLFAMFAVVIAVCWGLLGDKWLACASVYAWGFGDAAAALIGKRFGKHKIGFKPICGKKSREGTAAMFATSLISVLAVLLVRGGLDWLGYIVISIVTALVSAAIELFSRDGNDTITCPLGAMVTLMGLLWAFGDLL